MRKPHPLKSSPADIQSRLAAFHEGRDPEALAQKLDLLRQDPFSSFRGTCFLFYEDLDTQSLPSSPLIWATGDLHLQNFGTFKGNNRLTYYDLNDFDECALVPASLELVRMCASIFTAKLKKPDALASTFLTAYASTLERGKALWLERATSNGPIRDLLLDLKNRKRKAFLARRVKQGRIITDGKRALPLPKPRIKALAAFLHDYSANHPNGQSFFRLIDAARRIAGNGSLGLERYALLVQGRGSPSGAFLLDLKIQPGSALVAAKVVPHQPHFPSEAERVATIQHWCQAVNPALLDAVTFEERSFLLHELLPTDDRLDFTTIPPSKAPICLASMGKIVASSHLRSAARKGAAMPEELMQFGANHAQWQPQILAAAQAASASITTHWEEFCQAPLDANPAGASTASKTRKSKS